MVTSAVPVGAERARPMTREEKKVIFASSLGTVFEWYDFYLYGALAAIIAKQFFAQLDPTAAFIAALLAFASGFLVRPVRCARLRPPRRHDRPQVHLPGDDHDHGPVDGRGRHPAGLRVDRHRCADHPDRLAAPAGPRPRRRVRRGGDRTSPSTHRTGKRGAYTSWIQTTATLGLFLSLIVIIVCKEVLGDATLQRLGMARSVLAVVLPADHLGLDPPQPQRDAGLQEDEGRRQDVEGAAVGVARPVEERQDRPARAARPDRRQGVVWYTGQFYALFFLTAQLKVEPTTAQLMIGASL
jgi:hypothetical protein